ncbi:aminotransferase class I/II-fold pyridoxal phosphate-dependent enzyme [Paenibacillus sp.]|uniref:trans-sulfuration enzyme family protein n=1 Tax=Paenibacillus sp. TaxID=58172 RepID=UPI002D48AE67|nr:aminotransferase class I/II-fold pyridoxal phosphate-dependent enzyme [Paenibacillus sp.]HZG57940.1 aminotransferase class I/II-fold pyridoxal phosphate-dependent enzyme [Paenibacillus sp.]
MDKEEICTHGGEDYDRFLGSVVPPLFQTTVFTRKTVNHGYTYTRVANPTIEIAERKLAALEEGEAALCFSSGMAAISAVLISLLEQGSHVICPLNVYGPTLTFLQQYMGRFGVSTTTVNGADLTEIEAAIRPETKVIYLESPLSNTFELQDLQAVAALARARGITTVVDNTWATPLFQNPIALGIDLVVHSASKYLGGHGDILGGVVVGDRERMERLAREERGLLGAVMDPHQAWLLIRGLRTLPVRMRQHQESGRQIAAFLEAHPLVERVLYPGLPSHPQYELGLKQMRGTTGVLSFALRGGPERVMPMVKKLRLFEEGPSWGGFESLINTPGLWVDDETSARRGIPRSLVRISIGLERAEALMDDLDQALRGAHS